MTNVPPPASATRPVYGTVTRIRLTTDGPVHEVFAGRTRCGQMLQYALNPRPVPNESEVTCLGCKRRRTATTPTVRSAA